MPIEAVGIDYFGLKQVREGKRWTYLITCLKPHLVHLEIAEDYQQQLSSEVFDVLWQEVIQNLLYLITVQILYLVKKALEPEEEQENNDELMEYFANEDITWKFIMPLAP